MFIAREKKRTNIGEYFLYMFQIEDMIRACKFDSQLIEQYILPRYPSDPATRAQIGQWYFDLAAMMIEEHIEQAGHLLTIRNKIDEVFDFHQYLLSNKKEGVYQLEFEQVCPILCELQSKQTSEQTDLMVALNAIYGIVLLKMQNKPVSAETLSAITQLSKWIGILSVRFKEYEEGEFKLE